MGTGTIKDYASDNQAAVTSSHELVVTGNVTPVGTSNVNITEVAGTTITTGLPTNLNGLNVLSFAQYQVSTSAVQITIPSGTTSVALLALTSTSTASVVVGNSNAVTSVLNGTGNGFPLYNKGSLTIDVTHSANIWVIGSTSGQVLCVILIGN